jgi:hypothetical protein
MWEKEEDIKEYYCLVADPDDDKEGAVEITGGPFTGMVYKYGDFKFNKPESEDAEPTVEYHFEVIHIPEEIRDVEYPDEMKESFDRLLVSILIDLVRDQVTQETRVDYDSTNGEGDIDESFERRVFYKINNSVSEE